MEIIGEAVKKLSPGFRESHTKVPWRQIAGIRDVRIHDYRGVDLDMVWEVVEKVAIDEDRESRFQAALQKVNASMVDTQKTRWIILFKG